MPQYAHACLCEYADVCVSTPNPGHYAKGHVAALKLYEQGISCHLCPSKGIDPNRKVFSVLQEPTELFQFISACLEVSIGGVSPVNQNRKGAV